MVLEDKKLLENNSKMVLGKDKKLLVTGQFPDIKKLLPQVNFEMTKIATRGHFFVKQKIASIFTNYYIKMCRLRGAILT